MHFNSIYRARRKVGLGMKQSLAILLVMIFSFGFRSVVQADSRTSKATVYSVVAPPSGVNASKATVYSVVAPPSGVNASKATVYSVVAPPPGVGVSKANVYVVLAPPATMNQPSVFIITKTDVRDIPVFEPWHLQILSDIASMSPLSPVKPGFLLPAGESR